MQIVFRFNGSEELVVSTYPGGVMIERLDRDEPNYRPVGPEQNDVESPEADADRAHNRSVSDWRLSRTRENVPAMLTLSKGQARSIASALMQAASEV